MYDVTQFWIILVKQLKLLKMHRNVENAYKNSMCKRGFNEEYVITFSVTIIPWRASVLI